MPLCFRSDLVQQIDYSYFRRMYRLIFEVCGFPTDCSITIGSLSVRVITHADGSRVSTAIIRLCV